jgi:hypothetical protein
LRSDNATDAAPIHWPSALVGLALAVFVVVGVSWLAAPRASSRPVPAVTAVSPASATAAPVVQPTPIPAPPIATPAPERVKVSFANGSGVNLRAQAGERGQRLKTMPEGSTLDVIGTDTTADGIVWRNVRDASGTSGWMAGKFLAKVPQ